MGKGSTQQTTEQTIDQTTQQTMQQAVQQMMQQAMQQTAQQTVDQATQQATQQTAQQVVDQATQQATQQTIDQATQQTVDQATQQLIDQATTGEINPWAAAIPNLEAILGGAGQLQESGQLAQLAGFTPDQLAAFEGIRNLAAQPGAVGAAQGTLTSLMDPSQYAAGLEGVTQEALAAAIPAATAQFAGAGLADSTAAQQEVARAATQAVAPYQYQAYQTAQDRALQAAGLAPALQAAQYQPYQYLSDIGAQQQLQQQAALDLPYASLQRLSGLTTPVAGLGGTTAGTLAGTTAGTLAGTTAGTLAGTTAGTTAGTLTGTTLEDIAGTTAGTLTGTTIEDIMGTTTGETLGTTTGETLGTTTGTATGTTTQQQSPGFFDILGSGLQLLPFLGALSDRELKRNIRPIGKTGKGYPLYEFNYLWDDEVHVGVMADEVPHAIVGHIGSYAVIDYGKVL